jgi:hypothetical protein
MGPGKAFRCADSVLWWAMSLQCPDSLAAVAGFFNEMTPAKLEQMGDVYAPGVKFEDPINAAEGLAALKHVFEDLFKQLKDVHIVVKDAHGDERTGFLLWTMRYQFRGKDRVIRGTSHLRFAPDGRVIEQKDQWDASFVVYGEFPLIGWMMRGIRRIVRVKPLV